MIKIKLNDEKYDTLHILTRKEWDDIPNDYKTDFVIDYSKAEIIDKTIKSAFLPGYGARLFYENKHFLIIPNNAKCKKFAIWRNHKVIGYADIPESVARKANSANNAVFWFGFDRVTKPEKYID